MSSQRPDHPHMLSRSYAIPVGYASAVSPLLHDVTLKSVETVQLYELQPSASQRLMCAVLHLESHCQPPLENGRR
jgi:hypothetical protein